MADTKEKTEPTKTEAMLAFIKNAKGRTVEEIMEHTGQTKQVVRSRIYTLTKAGRIEAVEDSSPRRYKSIKPTKVA